MEAGGVAVAVAWWFTWTLVYCQLSIDGELAIGEGNMQLTLTDSVFV